jgi:putative redox protein
MTSEIIYKGTLRTEAKHLQSNTIIETDAPTDNQGSCMLTIMGIKARDMDISLDGTEVSIQKFMKSEPRRVGGIDVRFNFPSSLQLDEKAKTILERAALTCPVAKSIHPDIEMNVDFGW